MKKKFILIIPLLLIIIFGFQLSQNKEVKQINIGHQNITAQTWSAIIIKRLNLIEKYYTKEKIIINWSNFSSGPPITSNMIAGKIDIGFMGDMPLLINGDFGQNNKYYNSKLLLLDGKGINGINQDIIVKNDSNIKTAKDLAGKKISVPNSSSTHRHLLQELALAEIDESSVEISFQDIPTGIMLLEKGDIDAIVVWEPYSTFLTLEKGYHKIEKTSKNRYLAGAVINEDFINKNLEIYQAFELSLIEAHRLLSAGSPEIIKILSEESGFSEAVVATVIKNIAWEHTITDEDSRALEDDATFLKKMNKISNNFNLNDFIKTEK